MDVQLPDMITPVVVFISCFYLEYIVASGQIRVTHIIPFTRLHPVFVVAHQLVLIRIVATTEEIKSRKF